MEYAEQNSPEYWQETAASAVARVFFGHAYMIDALGTLLPSNIDLRPVHKVLDVGCGNGEWARRLGRAYPHIHVIGVDTSQELLQEAVTRASQEGLASLSFYQFG